VVEGEAHVIDACFARTVARVIPSNRLLGPTAVADELQIMTGSG